MYDPHELVDAIVCHAEDQPADKVVITPLVVAWNRFLMSRNSCSYAAILALAALGLNVSRGYDGSLELRSVEASELPLRKRLYCAGVLAIDIQKRVGESVLNAGCNSAARHPVLLPKAQARALRDSFLEALELYETGRFALRSLACAKMKAFLESLPAELNRTLTFEKEKDAFLASIGRSPAPSGE